MKRGWLLPFIVIGLQFVSAGYVGHSGNEIRGGVPYVDSLHVQGPSGNDTLVYFEGDGNGWDFVTLILGAYEGPRWSLIHRQMNDISGMSHGFGIQYWNGTTADMKLVIDANGQVGIGTSTPQASLEVAGNIIAAVPTQNNQVATKGYVDAQSAGFDTCDGPTIFIKFTTPSYSWNLGGKVGGDNICNTEFPGYHMCSSAELIPYANSGCMPDSSRYGFIASGMIDTAGADCDELTDDSDCGDISGRYLQSTLPWNNFGVNCCGGLSRSLSCCKT